MNTEAVKKIAEAIGQGIYDADWTDIESENPIVEQVSIEASCIICAIAAMLSNQVPGFKATEFDAMIRDFIAKLICLDSAESDELFPEPITD